MTRFARAKGSKASNERREEEATPWHVMRQQLAEQLAEHSQVQNEPNISYNLKEILSNGSNTQGEEVWRDFGETKSNFKKQLKSTTVKNFNKDCNNGGGIVNNCDETVGVLSRSGGIEVNAPSKKILRVEEIKPEVREGGSLKEKHGLLKERLLEKNPQLQEIITTTNDKKSVERKSTRSKSGSKGTKFITETIGTSKKKIKSLCGKNIFVETFIKPENELQDCSEKSTTIFKTIKSSVKSEKPEMLNKKTKKRKKISIIEARKPENMFDELQKPDNNFSSTIKSSSNEGMTSEVYKNASYRSDKIKHSNYSQNNNSFNNSHNYNFNENHVKKPRFSKYQHEKSFQTIIANGREIQVTHFHGFLVKKDDAVELKNLRKKLLAQNIPKEKLESIMKLERRKAEKALAREKKKVCYHCRQFGHNFSDCPEIKASDMVKTGVCFKCGSLEHSHFECKVLQRQEFRHAVCFVCKEQGHIARQCPLNSQGQYPKGGSCHLCGEVTHLRKDCPKALEEKPTKSVTVDTLASGQIEDMSGKTLQQKQIESKRKKVIKFN